MTQFVYELGTDIIEHRQYVDTDQSHLFARLEWKVDPPNIPRERIEENFRDKLAEPFDMQWSLHFSADPVRIAVYVTKEMGHLYTLVMHCVARLWNVTIPLIISNQPYLQAGAERFGIDFQQVPISKENKSTQERLELKLLQRHEIELVVLARAVDLYLNRRIMVDRKRTIVFD